MTTALILGFLGKFWHFILPGIVGVGILIWDRKRLLKREEAGATKERAKQAQAEAKARTISDDVENDVGAMTPEQRREALRKWSRG